MNIGQSSRDRIVGTVFLLAMAGILLPMWFDGAGVAELPDVRPAITPIQGTPPKPMSTRGNDWQFIEAMDTAANRGPLGARDAGEQTELGVPQLRSDGNVSANGHELPWAIQVASLAGMDAAKQLKDKLIAAGFHAYVAQARRDDGNSTVRVAVGPIVDRSEAERVRGELHAQFGLNGLLKRFDL